MRTSISTEVEFYLEPDEFFTDEGHPYRSRNQPIVRVQAIRCGIYPPADGDGWAVSVKATGAALTKAGHPRAGGLTNHRAWLTVDQAREWATRAIVASSLPIRMDDVTVV